MFEFFIHHFLSNIFGDYIEGFDELSRCKLQVALEQQGEITLTDIRLKNLEVLNISPIVINKGYITSLTIKIPFSSLLVSNKNSAVNNNLPFSLSISSSIFVEIDGLFLFATTSKKSSAKDDNNSFKRKYLIYADAIKSNNNSFFSSLLSNLQISLKRLHFRFEDDYKSNQFAAGILIKEFSFNTIDKDGYITLYNVADDIDSKFIDKKIEMKDFSIYWITPNLISYKDIVNNDNISMFCNSPSESSIAQEELKYILKPTLITAILQILKNMKSIDQDSLYVCNIDLPYFSLEIDHKQYQNIVQLLQLYTMYKIQLESSLIYYKCKHWYPKDIPLRDAKGWWLFAIHYVMEVNIAHHVCRRTKISQRLSLFEFCDFRRRYLSLYKRYEAFKNAGTKVFSWLSQLTEDEEAELFAIENELEEPHILLFRGLAISELKLEIDKYHPNIASMHQSWWHYVSSFLFTNQSSHLSSIDLKEEEKKIYFDSVAFFSKMQLFQVNINMQNTIITLSLDPQPFLSLALMGQFEFHERVDERKISLSLDKLSIINNTLPVDSIFRFILQSSSKQDSSIFLFSYFKHKNEITYKFNIQAFDVVYHSSWINNILDFFTSTFIIPSLNRAAESWKIRKLASLVSSVKYNSIINCAIRIRSFTLIFPTDIFNEKSSRVVLHSKFIKAETESISEMKFNIDFSSFSVATTSPNRNCSFYILEPFNFILFFSCTFSSSPIQFVFESNFPEIFLNSSSDVIEAIHSLFTSFNMEKDINKLSSSLLISPMMPQTVLPIIIRSSMKQLPRNFVKMDIENTFIIKYNFTIRNLLFWYDFHHILPDSEIFPRILNSSFPSIRFNCYSLKIFGQNSLASNISAGFESITLDFLSGIFHYPFVHFKNDSSNDSIFRFSNENSLPILSFDIPQTYIEWNRSSLSSILQLLFQELGHIFVKNSNSSAIKKHPIFSLKSKILSLNCVESFNNHFNCKFDDFTLSYEPLPFFRFVLNCSSLNISINTQECLFYISTTSFHNLQLAFERDSQKMLCKSHINNCNLVISDSIFSILRYFSNFLPVIDNRVKNVAEKKLKTKFDIYFQDSRVIYPKTVTLELQFQKLFMTKAFSDSEELFTFEFINTKWLINSLVFLKNKPFQLLLRRSCNIQNSSNYFLEANIPESCVLLSDNQLTLLSHFFTSSNPKFTFNTSQNTQKSKAFRLHIIFENLSLFYNNCIINLHLLSLGFAHFPIKQMLTFNSEIRSFELIDSVSSLTILSSEPFSHEYLEEKKESTKSTIICFSSIENKLKILLPSLKMLITFDDTFFNFISEFHSLESRKVGNNSNDNIYISPEKKSQTSIEIAVTNFFSFFVEAQNGIIIKSGLQCSYTSDDNSCDHALLSLVFPQFSVSLTNISKNIRDICTLSSIKTSFCKTDFFDMGILFENFKSRFCSSDVIVFSNLFDKLVDNYKIFLSQDQIISNPSSSKSLFLFPINICFHSKYNDITIFNNSITRPLLNFVFSDFKGIFSNSDIHYIDRNVNSTGDHVFLFSFDFNIGINYYNQKYVAFEPFCETSFIRSDIQVSPFSNLQLHFSSDSSINLNITIPFIETLYLLLNTFSADPRISDTRSLAFSLFFVNNQLGEPINFWTDNPALKTVLSDGQEAPIESNIGFLTFQFSTWDPVVISFQNRDGIKSYSLQLCGQVRPWANALVFVEIKYFNGSRHIYIRNNQCLVNNLKYPFRYRLEFQGMDDIIHSISSSSLSFIPHNSRDWVSISFSPQDGFDWITFPRSSFEKFHSASNFTKCFKSLESDSPSRNLYCDIVLSTKNDEILIKIQGALSLHNYFPKNIFFSLKYADNPQITILSDLIQSDCEYYIDSLDWNAHILFSFMIEDYKFTSWIDFYDLKANGIISVPIKDFSNNKTFVSLAMNQGCNSNRISSHTIDLFCSTWIVDHSDLSLLFGVKDLSENEVSLIPAQKNPIKVLLYQFQTYSMFDGWIASVHEWQFPNGNVVSSKESVALPSTDWRWENNWEIETEFEYKNPFSSVWHSTPSMLDTERRRFWVRTRVPRTKGYVCLSSNIDICSDIASNPTLFVKLPSDLHWHETNLNSFCLNESQPYHLTIDKAISPGKYSKYSHILYIKPRFIVSNKISNMHIIIQQNKTSQFFFLPSNTSKPFYFFSVDHPYHIRIKIFHRDNKWKWSSHFPLEEIPSCFSFCLLDRENNYIIIRVTLKRHNASLIIEFLVEDQNLPMYRISNFCGEPLYYVQDINDENFNNTPFHLLESHSSVPYAWEFLYMPKPFHLLVKIRNTITVIPIDTLGFSEMIKLPSGQSLSEKVLSCRIFADGPTTVVHFTTPSAVETKQISQTEHFKFEISLKFPQIGVSLVSVEQIELLFLSASFFSFYFCSFDTLSVNLQVRRIQIDNQLLDAVFPVCLVSDHSTDISENQSFLALSFELFNFSKYIHYFRSFSLKIFPFTLKIEERLLLFIFSFFEQAKHVFHLKQERLDHSNIVDFLKSNIFLLYRTPSWRDSLLFFNSIDISSINFSINVLPFGSSFSLFSNLQDANISFLPFSKTSYGITSCENLLHDVVSLYKTCIAFPIFLSFRILGNPADFVDHLSSGVSDFLRWPLHGIVRINPKDFVLGLGKGSISLVHHSFYATMNTTGNISMSIAQFLALTPLDDDFIKKRSNLLPYSQNLLSRVNSGISSLAFGIIDGISGLIVVPFKQIKRNGFLKGLLFGSFQGLFGFFVKPCIGTFDSISRIASVLRDVFPLANIHLYKRFRLPRMTIDTHHNPILLPYSEKDAVFQQIIIHHTNKSPIESIFYIDNRKGYIYVMNETYVICKDATHSLIWSERIENSNLSLMDYIDKNKE